LFLKIAFLVQKNRVFGQKKSRFFSYPRGSEENEGPSPDTRTKVTHKVKLKSSKLMAIAAVAMGAVAAVGTSWFAFGRSSTTVVAVDEPRVAPAHEEKESEDLGIHVDSEDSEALERVENWRRVSAMVSHLTTEDIERMNSQFTDSPLSGIQIVFLAWVAWLLLGACAYYYLNDWTYAECFYYAANVGYSIGFGALTEDSASSMLVSIAMICLGASAMGGALGFFISTALESSNTFSGKMSDLSFSVDHDGDGDVDIFDKIRALMSIVQKFHQENSMRIKVFSLLLIYVCAGSMFVYYYFSWDVVRSVYFAVSALSTAGLQAPEKAANGHIDLIPCIFIGSFTATGVPIFGLALGQFAGIFVDRYIAAKQEATLRRLITVEEFNAVRWKSELF
jgi:hypothetical protein